ncbi:hypothetical protein SO802_002136 [Lithocarpus litseifolius]|uniref:Uncharacterized protein n=1 Tax=Lithocarpus litseifolius TaxID=425828 RepID=A0AAW2DWB8_9ROSI
MVLTWRRFKSERKEKFVAVWMNVPQHSSVLILGEFNQSPSLTEGRMKECSSKEMMMGVIMQWDTLMLKRGSSKERMRRSEWNLREVA